MAAGLVATAALEPGVATQRAKYLLVTHGDVLFHEASPSRSRAGLQRGARPKRLHQLAQVERATLEEVMVELST